jgi:segregation and condensation protein B
MQDIANIIESLLFVADEPLSVDRLKSILERVETKQIKSALQALCDRYDARGGGFTLCEVAGGWQLRSRPEYNEWIKRMLQPSPQRLSKPALETLAIVAYNQPIIRADIEHIRGVDCGGVLRQLMERKLVRVLGRKEIPGRPLIYATTKLFLELFGLKDLKDLPSPKEIEEMAAAMQETDQSPSAAASGSDDLDASKGWGERDSRDTQDDIRHLQTADIPSRQPGSRTAAISADHASSRTGQPQLTCSGLVLQPLPQIGSRAFIIAGQMHPIPSDARSKIRSKVSFAT